MSTAHKNGHDEWGWVESLLSPLSSWPLASGGHTAALCFHWFPCPLPFRNMVSVFLKLPSLCCSLLWLVNQLIFIFSFWLLKHLLYPCVLDQHLMVEIPQGILISLLFCRNLDQGDLLLWIQDCLWQSSWLPEFVSYSMYVPDLGRANFHLIQNCHAVSWSTWP